MKFISVRDFRTKPKEIWKELSEVSTMTITLNGKPVAILLSTDDKNYEGSLQILRKVKAEQAVFSMQEHSLQCGLDEMPLKELEAEIKAARKNR